MSGQASCFILPTSTGAACAAALRSYANRTGIEVKSSERDASAVLIATGDASPATLDVIRRVTARTDARALAVVQGPAGGDLASCAALLLAGADDIVAWEDHDASSTVVLEAVLRRWARIEHALTEEFAAGTLIGSARCWRRTVRDAAEAGLYSQAPVLLCGPTGTGKELLAGLLHHADPREPKGQLVTVDCTTLSKELSGSELFGHEKGAFTGAAASRQGAVELADGGTLFLDEVGELPLDLQAQFLRVLQERTFKRVGSSRWEQSCFRLVCATNRDLNEEVRAGRFRRDLYHRIAATTIRTPSLEERREDILPLTEHFLAQALCLAPGEAGPALSPPVRTYLQQRRYEGNVRDLRQLVHAMARRYVGTGPVSISALPEEDRRALLHVACPAPRWRDAPELSAFVRAALAASATSRDLEDAVKDAAMDLACVQCGSVRLAALKLGVSERTIQVRRAARQEDAHSTVLKHSE